LGVFGVVTKIIIAKDLKIRRSILLPLVTGNWGNIIVNKENEFEIIQIKN